jgi:hypothetical protein
MPVKLATAPTPLRGISEWNLYGDVWGIDSFSCTSVESLSRCEVRTYHWVVILLELPRMHDNHGCVEPLVVERRRAPLRSE